MKPRLKMAMAAAEMLYSAKQREPQKQSLSGHFFLSGGLVSSHSLDSHFTPDWGPPPFLLLPSSVLWKSEARCQQDGITCAFPGAKLQGSLRQRPPKEAGRPASRDVPRVKPS